MITLKTIKETLGKNKSLLAEKYQVKKIGVFGSYVRNEQKAKSDIDVLVEFKEPIGMFEFMDLEGFLRRLLGVKVDLVSKKALKPVIGRYILKETVYI
ncbi:MAG: nucleotidyltransferase family protein [Candidatus Omnitrophota bacterium]|nr:nucleotidyltransferase family protein [Candidatus Omnitrophota bacterium]